LTEERAEAVSAFGFTERPVRASVYRDASDCQDTGRPHLSLHANLTGFATRQRHKSGYSTDGMVRYSM
jgi:hypothetical protein